MTTPTTETVHFDLSQLTSDDIVNMIRTAYQAGRDSMLGELVALKKALNEVRP